MGNGFQQPITVKDAIDRISSNVWILPGIQRKFVWDKERILNLFDSLLRGYPLGTLMVWKADRTKINKKIAFYTFLQHYQERFKESCDKFEPISKDIYSVIDGQQRLNSLYIGLNGTYATRLYRKKWRNYYCSEIQPEKSLYVNLCENDNSEDNNRLYKLDFFSDEEYSNLSNKNHWYLIKNVLSLETFNSNQVNEDNDSFVAMLEGEIKQLNIEECNKNISIKKLKSLYRAVFIEDHICYYQQEDNDLDKVLDIFIRSNSGGVPLSFSNLAMSVVCSSWVDAREQFDNLINLVRSESKIDVSSDFVMKCCLYLLSKDIKFKISNIDDELVEKMQHNFNTIQSLILSTFNFANQIGLDDACIRSKYALLPIIYYLYKNNINDINNFSKYAELRNKAGIFVKLALIKGLFGGSPDSVLNPIKTIIDKSTSGQFPLSEIIEHFAKSSRNLNLSDEDIKTRINETSYGTIEARIILSIITEMNPQHFGSYNHIDHLYPKSMFAKSELDKTGFLQNNSKLLNFYSNKDNWNTLGNLQLLNQTENNSKNKKKLSIWLPNHKEYLSTMYIPKDKNGSYIIADDKFKEFIEKRRKLLIKAIKEKIRY